MSIEVKAATMGELLAFFNAHSGKPPVKRFSDRQSAEKRVTKLLTTSSDVVPPTAPPPKEEEATMAKRKKSAAATRTKGASPKKGVNLSAAIAASWKDPKVAAARAARHQVKVAGTLYKSVGDAFRQLALPLGRHIGFRGKLKSSEDGRATFEHNDKKYNFILVQPEPA